MRARYAGFAVLLVVVTLLAVMLWYRQASLPVHEGTFLVPGLQQPVRIDRDAYGVPNIVAANERDATFALGYTHAQDRLWQMEMNRRIAAGRLAECSGIGARTDKFLRTIASRAPRRAFRESGCRASRSADAYADGVTLSKQTRLAAAPGFIYARAEPEPWDTSHSIGCL